MQPFDSDPTRPRRAARGLGGLLAASALVLVAAGTAGAQSLLFESFENIGDTAGGQHGPPGLISSGWTFRNQSLPQSSGDWDRTLYSYQGTWALYVDTTVSFWQNASSHASSWAILPAVPGQSAGDELRFFYSCLIAPPLVPAGRMEIRYSPSGGTNTGSEPQDVGDFTTLLLEVPYIDNIYQELRQTLPGSGRVALRLHIPPQPSQPTFFAGYQLDNLSIGPPVSGPPVPLPGETVTWTSALSPLTIDEVLTIPTGGTVIVDPGVVVNVTSGATITIDGLMTVAGTAGQRATIASPGVFPPAIEVRGGKLEADFTDFRGQLRLSGVDTELDLDACTFEGNGLILQLAGEGFARLANCTFTDTQCTMGGTRTVLDGNTFVDTFTSFGLVDGVSPNTFVGKPLEISVAGTNGRQPMYLDNVSVSGVTNAGGLELSGLFDLGPNVQSQGNLYPLTLFGGLEPGSAVPTTGNTIDAIDVGDGGYLGDGVWSNLGVPYRITAVGPGGGGDLRIEPGVTIEAAVPNAGLAFVGNRRLEADGLPGAPIVFRSTTPGPGNWDGILFQVNSDTGNRLEWCELHDANLGIIAADTTLFATSCRFENNAVGANANSFGSVYISGSTFTGNQTGMSFTDIGHTNIESATNPNVVAGNVVGVNGFESGGSIDAAFVWWGDPTGPQHPQNPGGQGDLVTGPSAFGVHFEPFLTAAPDPLDDPPVVRVVEPGRKYSTNPTWYFEPGSKVVLNWETIGSDVTHHRIEFAPDGPQPGEFWVVADQLDATQRSYELTVPDVGFAITFQPQFLRVVAVDASGQEGWDQFPISVPTMDITGNLTITTDLSGMTFHPGDTLPDMAWTTQGLSGGSTASPGVIFESDKLGVGALAVGGNNGIFFQTIPNVSTDRARLGVRISGNSNNVRWFLSDTYFSIRHDPRLGWVPPTVTVDAPTGQSFTGGDTVSIAWTASAPEGLRSFDVMASYDAGFTWHYVVRDLAATATSYDWTLPPSNGLPDVRVRVIARDLRFQNSADEGSLSVQPGPGVVGFAQPYGCGVNPVGSLALFSGKTAIGSQVSFGLRNPIFSQAPGSFTFLMVSTQPDPSFPCGTPLPGFGMVAPSYTGELLAGVIPPNPVLVLPGPPWPDFDEQAEIPLFLPPDPTLIGFSIYLQGLIADPVGAFGATLGLTNGLEVKIGS